MNTPQRPSYNRLPHTVGTMLLDGITHADACSLLKAYGASGASNTMPMPLGMRLSIDPGRQPMTWSLAVSPAYHDYTALARMMRLDPRVRIIE